MELRKLILGIYDSLPQNTSWRFLDKRSEFPNPLNPFDRLFREYIPTKDFIVGYENFRGDFIGIKTGDVNNSAGHQ